MPITRLSPDGYGARRCGSFAGKTEAPPPSEPALVRIGGFFDYAPEKKRRPRRPRLDDEEDAESLWHPDEEDELLAVLLLAGQLL